MTFQEALAKMQQGVPVRRPAWPPWEYFQIRNGELYRCRDGEGSTVLGYPNISIGAVFVKDLFATDWEEFTGKTISI